MAVFAAPGGYKMTNSSSRVAVFAAPGGFLDDKMTNSSSRADEDLKDNDNNDDQIKPVWDKPLWAKAADTPTVVKEKNRFVYNSEDPFFQKSASPRIKESCTLALEKYNKEEEGSMAVFAAPDKMTNSSSRADEDLKDKDNNDDQIKPVWDKPLWAKAADTPITVVKEKNRFVYNSEDPFFQKSVVSPRIKESCTLALEKYNKEEGTNYRYVCLLSAHEGGKTHDTIHTLIFRASHSDLDSESETFTAKFKSGFRISKGKWSYVKELQQVSREPVVCLVKCNMHAMFSTKLAISD